jgi:hypothetical protein
MKKFFRKIVRFWYIVSFNGTNEDSLDTHRLNGKFKVKYPDGKISQNFNYWIAKDYSEMFGGIVIDDF